MTKQECKKFLFRDNYILGILSSKNLSLLERQLKSECIFPNGLGSHMISFPFLFRFIIMS